MIPLTLVMQKAAFPVHNYKEIISELKSENGICLTTILCAKVIANGVLSVLSGEPIRKYYHKIIKETDIPRLQGISLKFMGVMFHNIYWL